MEKYIIEKLPKSIKYGDFEEHTYKKHEDEYGKESANSILKTATKILKDSLLQVENHSLSNNSLLVGKVQSGKTSNLEMLTSLAFDNGFNLMIIYGGYDSDLLRQCSDRFYDCFNDKENERVCLLSTDSDDFELYDNNFFESKFEENTPIIITSMKRPLALSRVNSCLSKIKKSILKAFIIDDEGDQASLNTLVFKQDASATYSEICNMKTILNNPIYFSVTATPQANIFQPDISALKPDTIHLIKPGNAYDGADTFHLSNDKIVIVPSGDNDKLDNKIFVDSLKKSIYHYLISSVIMFLRGRNKSEMIIHTYREIDGHIVLYEMVNSLLTDIKDCIVYDDEDGLSIYINEMKKVYQDPKIFDKAISEKYTWNLNFENTLKKIIKNVLVVQKNSKNGYNNETLKKFNYKIFIGGDLLQRGITFKNLVTTYFTRWAQSGNMDTSLQRARWFGYRQDFLDLCKVFTTESIKMEFCNLASIEDSLWNQFEQIENGELLINDIVVDANSTSLNPTRKNVASFKKAKFTEQWKNQRIIQMDKDKISQNNELFENLINGIQFASSSVARNDGKISTYYAEISTKDFVDFINRSNYIFDQYPFNKTDLITVLSKESTLCLELMNNYGELRKSRKRTFVDGKISYLQQGADTTDIEKQHYRGDSKVIVTTNKIIIQVFYIQPEISDVIRDELSQYMFSFHFPKKSIVYTNK